MAIEVAIIVTDVPPLITLAAARSLDYLLYPALPVIVPDAVFHEATAAAGKLGAQEILDWYRATRCRRPRPERRKQCNRVNAVATAAPEIKEE